MIAAPEPSSFAKTDPSGHEVAAPASGKPPSRFSSGTRRFFFAVLILLLLYAARHPLMSTAARWWIVDEPIVKSDVVVVLGGGLDSRPSFAAGLYRRGLVSLVLVPRTPKNPASEKGIIPGDVEITTELLKREGVPESAIQTYGESVMSTRDESSGVQAWLSQHPVSRIIIPTDPFHTRRVRWQFTRQLRGQHVVVSVASIPSPRYDPLQWWKSEEAMISFQNEMVKFFYYWLHY